MRLPIIRPNVNLLTSELNPILNEILNSNMLTNVHNHTKKFENSIQEFTRAKNVIAVSSGTSGLILALQALNVHEKEVIIPSFTFVSTAAAVYWTRNKIVYADIDDTFTLDVSKVKEAITPQTGAILAVHMYGNPAHINELATIARENKIPLIFDAAHALGSSYHGKKIGNFGDAEIFSLSPTKLLTSVEGGIITCESLEIAEKLKILRNYGMNPDYTSELPGLNARMSEIHAAVGNAQVKYIDSFVLNRNKYVSFFKDKLSTIKGFSFQRIPEGHISTNKDFSIVINKDKYGISRDDLATKLESKGISIKRYFYPPMHKLKAYEQINVKLPMTEFVSNNVLSLPIYNLMSDEELNYICDIIKGC